MDGENHYLMQFFSFSHLPENLQVISEPFHDLAVALLKALPPNPETTTALRKLLEAKDCAVRAALFRPEAGSAQQPECSSAR